MKKKLLILFTLIIVLTMALTITATCLAEETEEAPAEAAQEEEIVELTADNNATIWFKNVWEKGKAWVIGACSGLSVSAIMAAIILVFVRRITNNGIDRIEKKTDASTIADLATNKLEEHFANTTIDVNIAPLMEKQYKILAAEVYETLFKIIQKQDEKYLAMVKCFEKLSHYYDGSIGITDSQKEELAQAIAYAKSLYNEPLTTTAKIEVTVEAPKEEETEIKVRNY